jgi:putative transposase
VPFQHAPRVKTFDYRGLHRYFLTICCKTREPTLVGDATIDPVVMSLRRTAVEKDFDVIAYCLMPDHLHMFAEARAEDGDCAEFVRLFKQRSGYHWKRQSGRQLWQRSYFDRVLRNDESAVDVVRYIVNNPTRAGLVRFPTEYPYWGSFVYTREDLLRSIE